jgi:hypothetical protein
MAKPPREAYFYFPSENEKIECGAKSIPYRKIFDGGVQYTEFEIEKIDRLYDEIDKINYTINLRKTSEIALALPWKLADTLRFLQDNDHNTVKTLEDIKLHLQWRKDHLGKEITFKTMEILNSGFIYVHGRDSRFRPIIVLVMNNYSTTKYKYEDFETAIIYLLEYVLNNMLIPGQVEAWNIICDVQGTGLIFPSKEIKSIFSIFHKHYKCRLNKMWILNVGNFRSKMISKDVFVNKYNIKRVDFTNHGNKDIFKFVHPSQIEAKYYGTAENINDYLFPPISPSETYFIDKNDKEKLTPMELYIDIIKSNRDLKQSPYREVSNHIRKNTSNTYTINVSESIQQETHKSKEINIDYNDYFDMNMNEDTYVCSNRYTDRRVRDIALRKDIGMDFTYVSDDGTVMKNSVYEKSFVKKKDKPKKNVSDKSTNYEEAKNFNIEITIPLRQLCCKYNSRCSVI